MNTPVAAPVGADRASPHSARLLTIAQFEEAHPGFRGRMRTFIIRADRGVPDYAGLRAALVRLGRSVYVDEPAALGWLASRRAAPPSLSRNPLGRSAKLAATAEPRAKRRGESW